jgi:arylformamidase
MTQTRRLVELSHTVTEGMVTYPGVPGPVLGTHLSREDSRTHYAPGTEFLIGTITMAGNTGTYLDAPFHRYPDGADLAVLPLERMADLEAVLIPVTGTVVDRSVLAP